MTSCHREEPPAEADSARLAICQADAVGVDRNEKTTQKKKTL